jgi:hypothetical protein
VIHGDIHFSGNLYGTANKAVLFCNHEKRSVHQNKAMNAQDQFSGSLFLRMISVWNIPFSDL